MQNENSTHPLSEVAEGMKVFDPEMNEIGTVKTVYFGQADEDAIASGEARTPDLGRSQPRTLTGHLVSVFAGDTDMPQELQARLLQNGYFRVDAHGLFKGDYYVLPEQISGVTERGVRLNAPSDHLIQG